MNELLFESITKNKCDSCGDKSTPWENKNSILCDAESEFEFELDEELYQ